MSLLMVATGLAVVLLCAGVIDHTARLPAGDGTGMQWIVLTPLALLFVLVGLSALVAGVAGLLGSRSPRAARRGRRRAFKALFWGVAVALAVLQLVPLAVILIVDGWDFGR